MIKRSVSVGQQGDLTGALDGDGQLTLMLGAGAGRAAGQDLAALGRVAAKLGSILEINARNLVHAEVTNLSALAGPSSIIGHDEILLLAISGKKLNQNGSWLSSSSIIEKSEAGAGAAGAA